MLLTVVVVHSLVSPVIGNYVVANDLSRQGIEARCLAVSELGQVGLSIPRIDGTFVRDNKI
jgi:hypothetical protein